MRIGINTLFLVPGDVGGTEIYLRRNLHAMALDNSQHTFVLFTTRDNEKIFRADLKGLPHVEFVGLPFRAALRPLRILCEQALLPWYVWKNDIDVLWSPGYTAPALCSCPQAVTVHDLQYKSHPDDLTFLERKMLDILVRTACRRCDAVIAVSKFSKNEILRYAFAAEDKVFAVHEGVDPIFLDHTDRGIDDLEILLSGSPYILCVAHTYPHKQVHLLIDAFSQLAEKNSHHLVLVGRARRGEGRVRASLDRSTVHDRIHRFRTLEYENLRAFYQHADIFILPSEYEGFGLPILEAMLAGIPLITTNKASLPEVGGEHVVYVNESTSENFSCAISTVINTSNTEKAKVVNKARAWAKSFTWRRSADQTLSIFQDIAANKK
ncbi:MAG: glycosyltransferase family 1 protein [Candidatus Electrothrix sp. AR4]|nr:glycosyltransferase family 1 protein [Candidatus Electrothrix sp. AR4]